MKGVVLPVGLLSGFDIVVGIRLYACTPNHLCIMRQCVMKACVRHAEGGSTQRITMDCDVLAAPQD